MIVSTAASAGLARKVASLLGDRFVEAIRKRFPDGELYVRIPEVDKEIVVVGSTHQPNDNWVELLLLVDAATRIADDVKVVVPYYGYGRQDRIFLPGEPVSAGVFARALPVDVFATVEPHFVRDYGVFNLYGKEIHSLSAAELIGEYLRERGVDVVVSPDEGARRFASLVNEVVGAELHVFHKERDRVTGRIRMEGEEVEEDVVAIVDDIIGSGGTMLLASERIRARKLLFVAVHGVFSPGWERLKERGEVIVTDTIQREESEVSVAPVVAEWLRST